MKRNKQKLGLINEFHAWKSIDFLLILDLLHLLMCASAFWSFESPNPYLNSQRFSSENPPWSYIGWNRLGFSLVAKRHGFFYGVFSFMILHYAPCPSWLTLAGHVACWMLALELLSLHSFSSSLLFLNASINYAIDNRFQPSTYKTPKCSNPNQKNNIQAKISD